MEQAESFGYKIGWLAIAAENSRAIIDALKLVQPTQCSWANGIRRAYAYGVGDCFVTPPIDGYVLAPSFSLPEPSDPKTYEWLEQLADNFTDLQYYFSYRVSDVYAFARFINGEMTRAYAEADSEPCWDAGDLTGAEENMSSDYVNEELVLEVAQEWSINPDTLHERQLPPGWIGKLSI